MEPFLGLIAMFGGNFAPRGWAFCEGQLLPISQNQALFSILGTIYGGDGRTTFALPDMRGRTVIGPGNGPGLSSRREGQKGGTEYNTLNITQIPSHSHVATMHTSNVPTSNTPDNLVPAQMAGRDSSGNPVQISGWGPSAGNGKLASNAITVNNTGGGQSVNNMQPWISVYYIIAIQGTFPSRS